MVVLVAQCYIYLFICLLVCIVCIVAKWYVVLRNSLSKQIGGLPDDYFLVPSRTHLFSILPNGGTSTEAKACV